MKVMLSSSPQMGPIPPNEVGRIAQHIRKEDGIKGGKGDLPYLLPERAMRDKFISSRAIQ